MAGLQLLLVLVSSFGFLEVLDSSLGFLVFLASSLGFLVARVVVARLTGLLAFRPQDVEARLTEAHLVGLALAVDALLTVFFGDLLALEVFLLAGGLLDVALRLVD